jgi:hypothetical protein
MSTQVIETNLELMHLDLVSFINDEPLDMLDEFTDDEIANLCIRIANCFLLGVKVRIVPIYSKKANKGYCLKVNNNIKGFVSCSNDKSTGVSNTEYRPFYTDDPEDGAFIGLCSLASMINEAWYQCNK